MFTYYGDSLEDADLVIMDTLPECLEYANDADPEPTNISSDNKTIWWNSTVDLNDSDVITIEFDALVVNTTECCEGINTAVLNLTICGEEHLVLEDTAAVSGVENTPPTPPALESATSGNVGQELSFTVKSFDTDGDNVYYYIDWGDGNPTVWTGPYTQGVATIVKHKWTIAGTFTAKAKAKDSHGMESISWGNSIIVTITGAPPPATGKNLTIPTVSGRMTITATIKNNGTQNVNGINWSMAIEGKLIFTRKNTEANGTFNLTAGSTHDVTLKAKFGIGRITLTVKASKPGYGSVEQDYTGFVIGPLVLRLQPA